MITKMPFFVAYMYVYILQLLVIHYIPNSVQHDFKVQL